MQTLLGFLNTLLPIAYLMLLGAYVLVFMRDEPREAVWSRRLLGATLALHLGAVVVRTLALERLPLGAPLEFFSLMALSSLLIYALLERRMQVRQTGFVVVGLAFLLQFLASSFVGTSAPPTSGLLEDPGYALHAVLVLLAYTSLSLGFVYALLYLAQARQLSRRNFGLLFRRLPPLETLERMSVGSVQLGVPLLFAALATGHVWMVALSRRVPPEVAARLDHGDPKIIASWIIFVGYTLGLVGHRTLGWRGRRMNVAAIIGFVLMVIAIALVHHFFPSFHNFSIRGGVPAS